MTHTQHTSVPIIIEKSNRDLEYEIARLRQDKAELLKALERLLKAVKESNFINPDPGCIGQSETAIIQATP